MLYYRIFLISPPLPPNKEQKQDRAEKNNFYYLTHRIHLQLLMTIYQK